MKELATLYRGSPFAAGAEPQVPTAALARPPLRRSAAQGGGLFAAPRLSVFGGNRPQWSDDGRHNILKPCATTGIAMTPSVPRPPGKYATIRWRTNTSISHEVASSRNNSGNGKHAAREEWTPSAAGMGVCRGLANGTHAA